MNTKSKIIITVCVLVILLIVFYPKKRVVGGLRGFIMMNHSVYREEYSCLGIPNDFCPPWPDYGCDYLCYGLIYNRRCYNETAEIGGTKKTETECVEIKQSPQPPVSAVGTKVG